MASVPFLRRVRLKNYKSIGDCDVELGRFTILVGRNGSGKSNFLDALEFLGSVLMTSLPHTLIRCGGFRSITNRAAARHESEVEIGVSFDLPDETTAEYSLAIAETGRVPVVARERLEVGGKGQPPRTLLDAKDGVVRSDGVNLGELRMPNNHLWLPAVGGLDPAKLVFEALTSIRIYDPEPRAMRTIAPLTTDMLEPDGANAASVFSHLMNQERLRCDRITDHLGAIVEGLVSIGVGTTGNPANDAGAPIDAWLRFYFEQGERVESFSYQEVSDGTLRAFAVLLAANQRGSDGQPLSLIGIEEPESGLHPSAIGALVEGLREASISSQVIATTHSPEILDCLEFDSDRLLIVRSHDGETEIGPVSEANLSIIRDDLYSAGEQLRMDQFLPSFERIETQPTSTAKR